MARVINFPSPSLPMWVPSPAAPSAGPRIPNGYHSNGCSTGRYSASPSGSSSSSGSSRRSSNDGSGGWGGISKNPPSQNPKNMLFPFNPSLEEELNRLFTNFLVSHTPAVPQNDDVWEEFRHNGRDYEYCPDPEDPIVPTHSKKRNKKPLPSECVFCKNNGEDVKIYKKHLLKDADGRILCPILRNYTCPICGVNGDEAHTIKYCPKNKQTHSSGSVHSLKALRNSTGRRRSK